MKHFIALKFTYLFVCFQ